MHKFIIIHIKVKQADRNSISDITEFFFISGKKLMCSSTSIIENKIIKRRTWLFIITTSMKV